MSDKIKEHKLPNDAMTGLIVCPECDLLMKSIDVEIQQEIICPRCHYKLKTFRHAMVKRSLALVFTALILFIPSNFFPMLEINLLGQKQQSTVMGSVLGLYDTGMASIAFVVLFSSFAIPLCKLLCQLYVLLAISFNKAKFSAILFYKAYQQLKEWGMLEIYLLGILVSVVKLHGMAELHIGMGLFCFVGLLLVQVWLEVVMSSSQVWELLECSTEDSHASD